MFDNLGDLLCTITGFDSFSLQPNAGASGEYAGLMVIRAYHKVPIFLIFFFFLNFCLRSLLSWQLRVRAEWNFQSRGDHHRNVCIIPVSAHGTNPASAAMCGMKIVPVGTDAKGNINIEELRKAAEANKNNLSALMVRLKFSPLYVLGIEISLEDHVTSTIIWSLFNMNLRWHILRLTECMKKVLMRSVRSFTITEVKFTWTELTWTRRSVSSFSPLLMNETCY